ncbi:MAG TPA: zinc ribbon domain-containing protein [Thermoplasmata archaeon]|nr:zinc ribbon domain-containing protein [Thermoplasmata archaeon]
MPEPVDRCRSCGEPLPDGALSCPSCGAAVEDESDAPDNGSADGAPESDPPTTPPPAGGSASNELVRRVAKLQAWADGASALGVTLPSMPPWAEEFGREPGGAEGWLEVARGVERLAQRRVVTALEEWDRKTKTRLARLEAYSVDGRLERDQMEDVLHSARAGDVGQALATFQQVDRVVTLKERHLDQARDELERLVSLLRDMEALGLEPPEPPTQVGADLERELRGGRLAPLKQRLRGVRQEAVARLKQSLPQYVTTYGEFLLRERSDGLPIELEASELARGAREFVRGHPEEALRRLRLLAQVHGAPGGRAGRGPGGDGPKSTGAARTA